ncbi:hypothetical protein JCM16303_003939 [Sporobolomyces ruberrimus]
MDPVSPKLAPSSPSKIPRRRPSSSSSTFNMNLPSSPTKPSPYATAPPLSSSSRSNPWHHQTPSIEQNHDEALLDRRRTRTRTRTRTQSTDLSMDSTTEPPPLSASSSPAHAPPPRKLPPLSIRIPQHQQQHDSIHAQRSRSISGATNHSKPVYSPSSDQPFHPSSSSFTPRSRQPSHSQLYSQSLRTPRSSQFHVPHSSPVQPPPMSERPRITSSHFTPSRTPRDRSSTQNTTSTSNLATPATYESFDFPLPSVQTPAEEREARLLLEKRERRRKNRCCGFARLWTSSGKGGMGDFKDERTRLLRGEEDTVDSGTTKEQGKWEYVWGEVVCYAKHMLPPIFLFVVVVLVLALFFYKQAIKKILDDKIPPMAEEP